MSTVFFPRSEFLEVIEVVVERSFNRVSTRYLLVGAREKICFGVCKGRRNK